MKIRPHKGSDRFCTKCNDICQFNDEGRIAVVHGIEREREKREGG